MEKLSLTGTNKHATPDDFATLSAVLITPEEVFIDNGAIHGKSRVERGIQFVAKTPEEVEAKGGMPVYVVWVTLKKSESGSGFNGITASKIVVHKDAQAGYKSLPDLVNKMDSAMKGRIDLKELPEQEVRRLKEFLKEFRQGELWKCAQPHVHEEFAG